MLFAAEEPFVWGPGEIAFAMVYFGFWAGMTVAAAVIAHRRGRSVAVAILLAWFCVGLGGLVYALAGQRRVPPRDPYRGL